MAGTKEFNVDIDVTGGIKMNTPPNNTGVVLLYNSSSRSISTRTNAQFITDFNLALKSELPVYTSSLGITKVGNDFRPNYGTTANTIAQGNDSRINNGQTAFGWGNHASVGYAVSGAGTSQVRNNSQLDARYLQLTGGTMGNTATIYWNGSDYTTGIIHKHRNVTSGGFALARMSTYTHDKGFGISTTGDFMFGDWSGIANLSTSWNTIWHSGNFNPSDYVPYTGATANVNLGTRSITSTGGFIGNASTATTLATARTINGTSFNGSANITTVLWGTSRNITIGNTTKAVNGSGNYSWSLAEIGASSVNHTHPISDITGLQSELNKNRTYYTYYNNGLTSTGLPFKDENGDDFSTTSIKTRIYDIRLSTIATAAQTGARYVLYNDGSAWYAEEITPYLSSNFQARLRINSSGLPEIFNNQINPAYGAHANVTVYRTDAGKGTEWKRFISLDYNLLFNTPTIPTSSDFITTNTTQTVLSGNKTTSGRWFYENTNTTPITIKRTDDLINSSISFADQNNEGFNVGMFNKDVFAVGNDGALSIAGRRWFWVDRTGLASSQGGFQKAGQNNTQILLAGGGHRPVSDFALASSIPTVNNGQLTLTTGTGLSGSANFTANQSGNSSFSVGIASTHKLPTVAEWNALPTTNTITRLRGTTSGTYTSGDLTLLAGANTTITQSGANITIASTNTNTTYTAGTGLILTGNVFSTKFGTTTGTVAQGNDSRFHEHSNKSVLDGITSTKVSNWDTAFIRTSRLPINSNIDTLESYQTTYSNNQASVRPWRATSNIGGDTNQRMQLSWDWGALSSKFDFRIYSTNASKWGEWETVATQSWVNDLGFVTSDTTYTAGTGISLSGTTFGQAITTSGTGTYVQSITQTTNGFQINLGTPPNTTYTNMILSEATSGTATTGRVISAKTLKDLAQAKGWDILEATTQGGVQMRHWNAIANKPSAMALGQGASATRINALAMMTGATADGIWSLALGVNAQTLKPRSSTIGSNSFNNAPDSSILGVGLVNNQYGATVLGTYNLPVTIEPNDSYVDSSPLLIVGNGKDTMFRSNSLVHFRDGSTKWSGRQYYDPTTRQESWFDDDNTLVDVKYLRENGGSGGGGGLPHEPELLPNTDWAYVGDTIYGIIESKDIGIVVCLATNGLWKEVHGTNVGALKYGLMYGFVVKPNSILIRGYVRDKTLNSTARGRTLRVNGSTAVTVSLVTPSSVSREDVKLGTVISTTGIIYFNPEN